MPAQQNQTNKPAEPINKNVYTLAYASVHVPMQASVRANTLSCSLLHGVCGKMNVVAHSWLPRTRPFRNLDLSCELELRVSAVFVSLGLHNGMILRGNVTLRASHQSQSWL